jgi:hypothetical protein
MKVKFWISFYNFDYLPELSIEICQKKILNLSFYFILRIENPQGHFSFEFWISLFAKFSPVKMKGWLGMSVKQRKRKKLLDNSSWLNCPNFLHSRLATYVFCFYCRCPNPCWIAPTFPRPIQLKPHKAIMESKKTFILYSY